MKAQSIQWTTSPANRQLLAKTGGKGLVSLTRIITKSFIATVGALAVLAGTAVVVSMPQFDNYLQASLWALGLIFLALAVETRKPLAYAISGLVLPAIALLSYNVATEWAMVAAAVLAAWVVYAVYRK